MVKNKIDDGSSEMINFKFQYFFPLILGDSFFKLFLKFRFQFQDPLNKN